MTDPNEQAIRDRAYAIWEREGRPQGCERDHWLQAVWELSGEAAKAAASKTAKPARKSSARKSSAGKTGKSAGRRTKASK